MKKLFLSFSFMLLLQSLVFGQYWFGPKIGISYIDHVYQETTYEKDSFNVDPNLNFQGGLAFSYAASDMYAVYGELLYERVERKLTDKQTDGELVYSKSTNHFISAPIMLRITLGKVPFHYYVNGGPRLAYWAGGSGTIFLEEFIEQLPDPENTAEAYKDYKIKFERKKVEDNGSTALVSQPNRFQFGLTVGAGMYFDIQGGSRLQVDFRYTWQHSNMGSNNGSKDTNLDFDAYRENFEYYHNIATIGVAYLFNYDSNLRRKGKSSSPQSNKKKKK